MRKLNNTIGEITVKQAEKQKRREQNSLMRILRERRLRVIHSTPCSVLFSIHINRKREFLHPSGI